MPPKTPSFNYKQLQDRRTRIYTACISNAYLLGQVLDPDAFSELVIILRRTLKLKQAHESTLRDTLLEYGGVELTEEVSDRIAVRIAGGYDEIKAGKPIISTTSVPKKGAWMPIEVSEMRFDSVRNHKAYVKMTAMVLTGALAGRMLTQEMPAKATTIYFANTLGWAKFGPRPVHSELVQLKFTGLIVDDRRRGLQVDQYKCTAGQLKLNKELREARAEPCLLGHRYQCKTCPIGYSTCVRGTHRYTWVPRLCQQCKDERAIFDPAEPNMKVCLSCRAKRVRSVWSQERRGVT